MTQKSLLKSGIFKSKKFRLNFKEISIKELAEKKRRNIMNGGKGDNLTIQQLIDSNSKIDILNEIKMGIQVEYEHTNDFWTSLDIVMDHMAEFPDYYTRLKKMEKEAKKYWG